MTEICFYVCTNTEGKILVQKDPNTDSYTIPARDNADDVGINKFLKLTNLQVVNGEVYVDCGENLVKRIPEDGLREDIVVSEDVYVDEYDKYTDIVFVSQDELVALPNKSKQLELWLNSKRA